MAILQSFPNGLRLFSPKINKKENSFRAVLFWILFLTFLIFNWHFTNDVMVQVITTRTLTVTSSNPDSGVRISVTPYDNFRQGDGTTPFTRTYNNNTRVTLTAPQTAGGNKFQKWQRNGADYANTTETTVTMNADYRMTAVYARPTPLTQTLTVASSNPNRGVPITVSPNDNSGQGNGTTPFTRIYNDNTVVTLTAPQTAGGNNFQKWQRNGVDYSNTAQTTVTMNADYRMTAVYAKPTPVTRTLTVASSNPDSGVTVSVSPSDTSGLGTGTTPFSRTYNNNMSVTLTATSNAGGNNFQKWQRNGVDYANTIQTTVTMNDNYTLTAIYVPPKRVTNFAVYAQEHLTISEGSSIKGGDIGVAMAGKQAASGNHAMSESASPYRVQIMGAQVEGDVYGDTVFLGKDSQVKTVFTNHLTNEGGRYENLAPFPSGLPNILPVNGRRSEGLPILVPANSKARMVLGERHTEVRVEEEGTAVLTGGRYEFDTLELGSRSKLIVEEPSLLIINRILKLGEESSIIPSDKKVALNLTVVIRGTDQTRSAAVFGKSSEVQAAVRVPKGTLEVKDRVNIKGSLYGWVVKIGEKVKVDFPGFYDSPEQDPQCLIPFCREEHSGIVCQMKPKAGVACEDGNACTTGDVCTAEGYCKSGDPVPDPDPNGLDPCKRDTCDPFGGIYEPIGTVCDSTVQCMEPKMCDGHGNCSIDGNFWPPGTPCDDGIPNNGFDRCIFGNCLGTLGQFDCKANTCSPDPSSPPDLTCWLNTHPAIRDQIYWRNPGVYWTDWTPAQKQELEQAFLAAWNWLAGGMTNFQGTPIPEPPPNNYPESFGFSETIAWQLYLAKIAHSLAIEIGRWVPWSLCDYSTDLISQLLNSQYHYSTGSSNNPDYHPYGVTPAHPTFTYSFLYNNGLIGATRFDTIANLLHWCNRLRHFVGWGGDPSNLEAHWQYIGYPPVSRTIEGTCAAIYTQGCEFGHWTKGCGGTTDFLIDVLRSVNIPVKSVYACSHSQPYFPSEGLYLSHGDDPYSAGFWYGASSVFPQPGEILIDQTTYNNWFINAPDPCINVGRRPMELALQLLPDPIVQKYCQDVANNTPHDSGLVYDWFDSFFTLQELEATNLWHRLCLRATELGLCACPALTKEEGRGEAGLRR